MSRWFRYYDDAMNDPKLLMLPDALFRAWVTLLCVASQHDGKIPSQQIAAICLRVNPRKAGEIVGALASGGLLDKVEGGYFEPHNWKKRQFKSDVSNERVKQHRQRKRNAECNVTHAVTATPPDTEAETDTETEADQRSLTSLQITTSEGKFCENVKAKRRTPPRHCAVSRDKKHVYIETNTPEWEAYAADFRAVHHQEPQPNSDGGKWFAAQGEAA